MYSQVNLFALYRFSCCTTFPLSLYCHCILSYRTNICSCSLFLQFALIPTPYLFTEISLIAAFKHVVSNILNLSVVCYPDSKLP